MAKLKHDLVTKTDLMDYLTGESDFSFEVSTLRSLVKDGFSCDHGGTYIDPVTQKPRAFDIRAVKHFDNRHLRLAVECKNIRPYYPLLVSCVPRRDEEAFHEIIYSVDPERFPIRGHDDVPGMSIRCNNFLLGGDQTIYKVGEPVGKSCVQVGRLPSKELSYSDTDIYDKWAQALNSADDVVDLAFSDGERQHRVALTLVFPIVVVPNGSLWRCEYDADGTLVVEPQPVDHCSFFVGREYDDSHALQPENVTLSHVDFLTSDGLLTFTKGLCDKLDDTFPWKFLKEATKKLHRSN